MMPTPSPVAAREIVHLLILRRLTGIRKAAGMVVKGGVNLRLFFDSVRYSEDMDLDGTPQSAAAIRASIVGMFDDRALVRQLQAFGIRELDPGQGPNKDTDTTFRYKFGVVVAGAIRYPTKVEVSFRGQHEADRTVSELVTPEVLRSYRRDGLEVRHYTREAAVRQKVEALGGRREAQARDVFDLNVLVPELAPETLVRFLAKHLASSRLREAHARALAITFAEYQGQVFEFLSDESRARHGGEAAWDDMRLRAAALIESVLEAEKRT